MSGDQIEECPKTHIQAVYSKLTDMAPILSLHTTTCYYSELTVLDPGRVSEVPGNLSEIELLATTQ